MKRPDLDTASIVEFCRKNDVARMSVFGSVARGESSEESDIDLLVRFSKPKSLLALVRLEREMTDALGRKVDLLTEAALSPLLRDKILNDLQVIYET